ncbi:MAG: AAA domain-containing protein [Staphylococcus equorum]|nr:AAA domain-containing protein [Staphylococcus equorum]MDN6571669.1 AAA domain-containing protein [Staphylococcus equorum]MDN6611888.1 AAA domain-containing protein [Staphylococcus equorum]MDN6742567.1 AAA domain-containing protein [Staphylococcus equorum]MDN6842219.1 AAA domain-containing protein [Staphylococcus equorum]
MYKRGTQRNNEIEAKAVVEIIIRHLKSNSKDSIGVITFNIQQQNTIEDLFNNELTKYPLLDSKNMSAKEPVFIKNLENVQGDERDIILFSTTFGPDEEGKMTMNFGPLNNSGGWRRLNVAITRARKEMKIITSFNPEVIDIKRTKAEGVIGLKGFVEYARNADSLPSINSSISADKNGIATILKEELYNRGINAKVHLGNSKFKIDLAIIDPENNDKYKLAILIDGQNYYQAQAANDRNIIQPSVLEGLGWNIHRIWTIDWYEDKNKEIEKVLSKIESIDNEMQ